MKDLILITNYSNTPEKQEILRNLVNQISQQKDFFDLLLVSHTTIPEDVQSKCNYTIYDYKNELLYDLDLRNTSTDRDWETNNKSKKSFCCEI